MVSLILSIMGCTGTFSTANIAIVPIALAFSRKLGYDRFLAFALSYLAVNAGFSAGEVSIFTTSIAQEIAEVDQFSGMGLRVAEHVIFFCHILCIHRAGICVRFGRTPPALSHPLTIRKSSRTTLF